MQNYNEIFLCRLCLHQSLYLCGCLKNQTMIERIKTSINSEIGQLEAVILHRPGPEVENMTPQNAERALYSDILNLSIATIEYNQLKGVLNKVCRTLEVSELLTSVLERADVKKRLLWDICCNEGVCSAAEELELLPAHLLAKQLIEGVPLIKDNLTRYLSDERYLLRPLHNLFFTRDSAMGYNGSMFIGRMANRIRERESMIVEAIFNHHPIFETTTYNPVEAEKPGKTPARVTLEGGDFQVGRHDVLVIGTGVRTSTQGIDFILEKIKATTRENRHIIVQELPVLPESFIHLDMVFTFLDQDACMVYDPMIFELNRYRTIHVEIDNGCVKQISQEANIPQCLKKLGMDLKPIACGGKGDTWIQEREQWHSGANFFAFAPGKVIGYERNVHTLNELNKNGFEIIAAQDVIAGTRSPSDYQRCVVTIAGSELARGGGGARCMTMPVRRKEL
jgi:arginine deiminase